MALNFTIAFLGGLLTFLSPCGAFLLPAFLACATASISALLSRLASFALGLLVALLPLGLAAGGFGTWLRSYQNLIVTAAAVILILAGVLQALNISLPTWHLSARLTPKPGQSTSQIGLLLLGVTYGLAGVGCTGPILGAVLTTAAGTGSMISALILMLCYTLGMFSPVALLSLVWNLLSLQQQGWARPRGLKIGPLHTTWGGLFAGLVFVALGVFLLFSQGSLSRSWLNSTQQFEVESSLGRILAPVPNLVFLLLLLALVGLIVSSWWYLAHWIKEKNQRKNLLNKEKNR